jgi:CheY-like chemotaxis protein
MPPSIANREYVAQMKGLRVLVVEDDAIVGMLLAEILVDLGCGVCAIETTAAGAVTAALLFKPDLMIVDAWLGNGSGIRAVDEIIQFGSVPHVFVSGDALGVQVLKPRAIVLQKPFRESDLTRAMRRALGRSDNGEPAGVTEHITAVTGALRTKVPPRPL